MAVNGKNSDLSEIKRVLIQHPDIEIDGKQLKCTLTGHELPLNRSALERYINCSKYKRYKSYKDTIAQNEQYFEDKGPYIQCLVTGKRLSKEASDIARHVEGKKFKRMLVAFLNPAAPQVSSKENNELDEMMDTDEDIENEDEAADIPYPEFDDSGLSNDEFDMRAMDTDGTNANPNKRRQKETNEFATSKKKKR